MRHFSRSFFGEFFHSSNHPTRVSKLSNYWSMAAEFISWNNETFFALFFRLFTVPIIPQECQSYQIVGLSPQNLFLEKMILFLRCFSLSYFNPRFFLARSQKTLLQSSICKNKKNILNYCPKNNIRWTSYSDRLAGKSIGKRAETLALAFSFTDRQSYTFWSILRKEFEFVAFSRIIRWKKLHPVKKRWWSASVRVLM